METGNYVQLHHLVDFEESQGHWIHAKVLEISEDHQTCRLSLFNNQRNTRNVPMNSAEISPFHSHDLSASLSETKYLRYWVFDSERMERSLSVLQTVTSQGLLSLSAYDTAQFFGAQLPHLFVHCISKLPGNAKRMKACEETMVVLARFLHNAEMLARAKGAVLGSVERALWSCWPECVFLLRHTLEDLPASAPAEDFFDIAVSDYTSAKCSRLCAHFLEHFAQAGGFDALARCFSLPLPLDFLTSLPILRLVQQLSSKFCMNWTRSVVESVLEGCPIGPEAALTLLTTAYRAGLAANIDITPAFRAFLQRTAASVPESSPQFLWVVRAGLQLNKVEMQFEDVLADLMRSETQLSLLFTGEAVARETVEQYAMTLATRAQLPTVLLELYVSWHSLLSETFLTRLLAALVQRQQWDTFGSLETPLPVGDFSITLLKSAKLKMPLPYMLRLFPRVNSTNASRLVHELLNSYSLEDCAWAFLHFFNSPQQLLAVIPGSKLKAYVNAQPLRLKLSYFVFTQQRLVFLWISRKLELPEELIQVVAQEFL